MTVPSFEFIFEGQEVNRAIHGLEWALSSEGLALFLGASIGPYLAKRARARFANEGDDVTGKWAPLLPATQNIRATSSEWSIGPAHPINKRTGELEEYIAGDSWAAMPNGQGASLRYPGKAPGNSELRQKVETAQKGRTSPRTVPRPVLGINERDMLFTVTELVFFIAKSAKTGGAV